MSRSTKWYDLYVAIDTGSFTKLRTIPASNLNTVFHATSNHSYFFRSIARDVAGNQEVKLAGVPDAQITVGDFDPPVTNISNVTFNTLGTFAITLTGTDSGGGSLRFFDVYVAIDQGGAELVSSVGVGTPNAQGVYTGSTVYQGRTDNLSHTYRFFSIGRDSAGNVESAPGSNSDFIVIQSFASVGLRATGIDVQLGSQERSYIRNVDVIFNSETNLVELLAAARIVVNGDGDFVDAEDASFEFHRILGDANGDTVVNNADLAIVNSQQGRTGALLQGDMDGNGVVNFQDRNYVNSQKAINRHLDEALIALLDD